MSLDALYRDILAAPEDDAPRLRYAEACQKLGDPRGEFIRAQLALAEGYRRQAPATELGPLVARSQALIQAHGPAWMAPVASLVTQAELLRGFVGRVKLPAMDFLARGAQIRAAAPVLHVTLTDAGGQGRALAACGALSGLVSLDLYRSGLSDADVEALAQSPHLGRLAWLALGRNRLGERSLRALAASRALPGLRYLEFSRNLAPDPCDQPSGLDGGRLGRFEPTEEGAALEAEFGPLPWLHPRATDYHHFPPRPVSFVGLRG